MLPKLDGLGVIAAMRRRQVRTPVLILSARHTVDDRVKGLETGGDDYLTKPFAFPELLARVQALIRRCDRRLLVDATHGWRPDAGPHVARAPPGRATTSSSVRASSRCSNT